MRLTNETPFAMERFVEVDRDAAEHLVVTLKGTWRLEEDGSLALAEEQPLPSPLDVFRGEPDASSILAEAELAPLKPATEILVAGHALAPRRGTRAMDVLVAVGPIRKLVRVFGERRFEKRLAGAKIAGPEPFERVELAWENAYGGVDETPAEKHRSGDAFNPVGRGFRAKRSKLPVDEELLPNVEYPDDPYDKPGKRVRPAGLGAICRHWMPRLSYAGTYDQEWLDDHFPFLPRDFDARFHHAASPDQIARGYLRGGEPVELVGLTPTGRAEFRLPEHHPVVSVKLRKREERAPAVLETIGFHSDSQELRLLWKARLRVHRELLDIRDIACSLGGDA
ncbi:MAG: DUF2169 domain-containing protein [Gemmatimonadetes bacterium]|nr:DUF2169 domain-containing protein [Gemmatimonadota bacterium]